MSAERNECSECVCGHAMAVHAGDKGYCHQAVCDCEGFKQQEKRSECGCRVLVTHLNPGPMQPVDAKIEHCDYHLGLEKRLAEFEEAHSRLCRDYEELEKELAAANKRADQWEDCAKVMRDEATDAQQRLIAANKRVAELEGQRQAERELYLRDFERLRGRIAELEAENARLRELAMIAREENAE